MNKKVKSILQMLLPIMLLLSFASVFTACALPEKPKVRVVPKDNVFSTDPASPDYKAVGDIFTVNVTAVDWPETGDYPGLFALSFKLYYDNTILEALSISPNDTSPLLPPDHFMVPGTHWPPGTYKKGGLYIVAEGTGIWHAEGYAGLALTLTGDEPGHVGTGTIAQITFKITKEPTAIQPCSCPLELKEVTLSNPKPEKIPPETYDVEIGYYEYAMPPPPKPVLKVTPETFIWDIKTAEAAGRKFNVTVDIENLDKVWRLVGVQFKLRYDKSLLNTTRDWITQGDFFDPFIPHNKWFEKYVEEDPTSSYGIVGILILPNETGGWEVFPEGSGTIVNIQFEAIYIPPPSAGCDLTLDEVRLVNDDIEPIDKEVKPGRYDITVAPPPWLSIEPSDKTVSVFGEEFDLTVLINELVAGWRMVGAEFKIRYNKTLFNPVNITEGGFMLHFAALSGTSTWFQPYVDEDPISGYGLVGIMILPNETAVWKGPFPDTTDYGAPGDLAIVRFTVRDWYPELISEIWLDEIILADTEVARIPYNEAKTAIEGICTIKAIPPFKGGLDLMTQYPDPWSGRGLGAASDAFPPQGVVALRALVTYQGDVVPGKPVSYAIIAPKYGGIYYATNFTGEDGIAVFEYALPGSDAYFGLWTVKAGVDLAGTTVYDTLYFLMGWLVEVVNIEAPEIAYKGDVMGVNTTLTRISMQDPRDIMNSALKDSSGKPITNNDLLLFITVTDELKQLVATSQLNTSMITEIGVYNLDEFVWNIGGQWMNHIAIVAERYPKLVTVVRNGIPISSAAFSGVATIHANLLTDFPGVAYSPEGIGHVWIKKRT